MKKFKKHIVTLAVALALVGSFVLGANASTTLTAIQAYLNYGITIEYNGEPQQMFDANGVRLYPITYNNSTYVPIRAVSNILGVNVDWDQATKTVILGTPADGVDLVEKYKPYTTSCAQNISYKQPQRADGQTCSVAGKELNHWLELYYINSVYGSSDLGAVYYNIGEEYGTLTFQAYCSKDVTLEVRGNDDAVLASIPIQGNQLPKTYTVPLAGASQLCISAKVPYYSSVYIFDAVLK